MIVNIKLRTQNIFDVDSRINEIREIKEWLDELTEWQEDKYSMKVHFQGRKLAVWFEDDEHAILCKLRWS
jgi:hypothetical protein